MSLKISSAVFLRLEEVAFEAIRAQGSGGQNVNKVSSAIHLRFDISASSLPEFYKERLLGLKDNRINNQGILVIKAQRYRTQDKNKRDAIERLITLIKGAIKFVKARKETKPTRASQRKRIDSKTKHGQKKVMRKKIQH